MDEGCGCVVGVLVVIVLAIIIVAMFWQYILLFGILVGLILLIAKYPKEIKNAISVAATKTKEVAEMILGLLFAKYRTIQDDKTSISIFSSETENKTMSQEWMAPDSQDGWSEKDISVRLISLQDRPQAFQVYVDSLVERFVNNQNTKIAKTRVNYLQQQIEILKLANQYVDLKNELANKGNKFENELLRTKNENQQLRLDRKNEASETTIQALADKRRRLEEELKIAQLESQIENLKKPPEQVKQPEKPTKEEIKAKKEAAIRSKIKTTQDRMSEIENDDSLDDHQKTTRKNQLENRLFEYNEELDELI